MDSPLNRTNAAPAHGSDLAGEDQLTEEVWGLADFLPREIFLRPLLAEVARLNPRCSLVGPRIDTFLDEAEQAEFEFRPGCHPEMRGAWTRCDREVPTTTIPDVLVEAPSWVIVVEAKFGSPLGVPIDQLPREFGVAFDLARSVVERPRDFLLVTVTQGHSAPQVRTPLPIDLTRKIVEGHERTDVASAIELFFDLLADRTRDQHAVRRFRELRSLAEEHVAWIGWPHIAAVMKLALARLGSEGSMVPVATLKASAARLAERGIASFASRGIAPFGGFSGWGVTPSLSSYTGGKLILEIGERE